MKADIGVVAAYGKILPDWLLAALPRGLINVHASLLPRYRGASPIHRAVIAGDRKTGVTIMRVVKALDAGPMIASGAVPIGPDDTTSDVESTLAIRGAELLVETLDAIEAGYATETPQDEALVTYAPKLSKAEATVDWTKPASDVHNLIRGLWPWPHAHTFLGPTRYILHRSRLSKLDAGTRGSRHDHHGLGERRPARGLWRFHRHRAPRPPTRRQAGARRPGRDGREDAGSGRAFLRAMIAPARRAAMDALVQIDEGDLDLGEAVARARQPLGDERDRGLLLELVAGTLRMQRAIDYQLASRVNRPLDKLDAAVLRVLRLSAFQLIYLSRLPASAIINDAVELTRRAGKTSAAGLANAVLRALSKDREQPLLARRHRDCPLASALARGPVDRSLRRARHP